MKIITVFPLKFASSLSTFFNLFHKWFNLFVGEIFPIIGQFLSDDPKYLIMINEKCFQVIRTIWENKTSASHLTAGSDPFASNAVRLLRSTKEVLRATLSIGLTLPTEHRDTGKDSRSIVSSSEVCSRKNQKLIKGYICWKKYEIYPR